MRISATRSPLRQLTFWETPLRGHGHIRTVIGNIAERLALDLTGGRLHRTGDGREGCYSPDVSILAPPVVHYFEVKAAGRNRETFVYEGRLVRDRAFVAAGNSLSYLIWHHRANTQSVDTVEALRALVLSTLRGAYLVPFPAFDTIAQALPVEALNSAYGCKPGEKQRRVYGRGRRIKISALESYRLFTWENGLESADWPRPDIILQKIPKIH